MRASAAWNARQWADERALLRDALKHGMGGDALARGSGRVRAACRIERADRSRAQAREWQGARFTTAEMQGYEREIIERMRASQGNREVLADGATRQWTAETASAS